MPKIFLYGLSLVLLFNNAYTSNTMQYIPNNKQQFFDQIPGKQMPKEMNTMTTPQEINAINPSQKMNIIKPLQQNMGLQQKLPTPRNQQQVINQLVMQNQINQQPVDMQKELVDKTAPQNIIKPIDNNKKNEKRSNKQNNIDTSNLPMAQVLRLLLEKVWKIEKEQAKVNAQVKKQQAEHDKAVKQALTDFYNAKDISLTLPDGTHKIITRDDIDPNILCKYSSEKPPKNTSTMVDTNIIYPAHYFPKDSSQKQKVSPQYLYNNQKSPHEFQQQQNMQQYLQHEQAAPRYATQAQNSPIEVQQKQNFQQDFSQSQNIQQNLPTKPNVPQHSQQEQNTQPQDFRQGQTLQQDFQQSQSMSPQYFQQAQAAQQYSLQNQNLSQNFQQKQYSPHEFAQKHNLKTDFQQQQKFPPQFQQQQNWLQEEVYQM